MLTDFKQLYKMLEVQMNKKLFKTHLLLKYTRPDAICQRFVCCRVYDISGANYKVCATIIKLTFKYSRVRLEKLLIQT